MIKKIEYNIQSSKKNKWTPEWFDCDTFDESLIHAIMEFQKENGMQVDGLCGPSTLRRLETQLLADEDFTPCKRYKRRGEKGILYKGELFPINWDRVIIPGQRGALVCEPGTYTEFMHKPKREPIQFVNHWDATLSSEACARIIKKRGLSMHFLIDNDGTIYQMLDIQQIAWQAGSKFWNMNSIGVEISNAFYTKYQNWYVKKGFGERPIVESYVNGRSLGKHLDFYPVQLEALAALWAAISNATGINMDVCDVQGYCKECDKGQFNGFINHYNLTRNKIDCASLDMQDMLSKASVKLDELC